MRGCSRLIWDWEGIHNWGIAIGDAAGECDQKYEKNEAARSHGLFLLRHNLILDHFGDHDVLITALDGLRFHL